MNKFSPLVSVVIPVYKVESYIGACIESVIMQSYSNLEIILVDDGSPDRSGIICDKYARHDSRIKVIHNENQGVSAARSCGVRNAHGAWLTFLDSDDTLPGDAVESLLSIALEKDYGIVIGFFDNKIPISTQTVLTSEEYVKASITGDKNVRTGLWGKLYDISLLTQEAMDVPRDIVQGQDMLVNLKLALANKKEVVLIPKSVYNYRQNAVSVMHTCIPSERYLERHNDLLVSYIPQDRRKELRESIIIAKVNSLLFLTISSQSTRWRKSDYAKGVKLLAKNVKLPIRQRLLLICPTLCLFLYNMHSLFRRLKECV